MNHPVCRHCGQHLANLDRRYQRQPLTDSRIKCIPKGPVFIKDFLLGSRPGDKPRRLPFQINAGGLPKAILFRISVQVFNAGTTPHFIKIYVIRHGKSRLEIDPA